VITGSARYRRRGDATAVPVLARRQAPVVSNSCGVCAKRALDLPRPDLLRTYLGVWLDPKRRLVRCLTAAFTLTCANFIRAEANSAIARHATDGGSCLEDQRWHWLSISRCRHGLEFTSNSPIRRFVLKVAPVGSSGDGQFHLAGTGFWHNAAGKKIVAVQSDTRLN
jgi:hypothetical protein